MMTRRIAVGLLAFMALLLLRNVAGVHADDTVTYRAQVAPILYKNCTSCHHAGGSGPFSLMTYADARRWGTSITAVTSTRYMPPWLPAADHGVFAGDRRMSADEIAVLGRWVAGGMVEGEGTVPAPPVYRSDWQLGPPDLVLEMTSPLEVPAGGQDLFMNFAMPAGVTRTRWVRAMEIKPGVPQLVHHANVIIDRTASLRRAHPDTWRAGVPGMDILVDSGETFDPDSHFLFWKPDSTALVEPDTMPWRLDPGNDLVLNMHLKPTGKVERVQARIGLYFTDKPASAFPMLLQLEHDDRLDIPAGAKDFVVEDSLTLPVAVDVLGVYPHAHYLGKRMEGWATLPTGERKWLVLIEDWDIDRQSVYRLAQPLALPKGSVLHMRYTYDNSAANARNPHTPPVRVQAGNRSVDEMGHLWLQVLPHADGAADGRAQLEAAWMKSRLKKNPGDSVALYNLGSLAMMAGDGEQAAALYQRVLAVRPGDARALTSVGSAQALAGDWQGAQNAYQAALKSDPANFDAAFDLAQLELRHDQAAEAEALLRGLVLTHPQDAPVEAELGNALALEGNKAGAMSAYEAALALDEHNIEALFGLGKMAADAGDHAAAITMLSRALKERPDADAERLLAQVYAASGAVDETLLHLRRWQQLAPMDPDACRALAQVLSAMGRDADAVTAQRAAVKLAPRSASDWNDLGALEARAGERAAAVKDLTHALELDPFNAAAKANLGKL